MFSNTQEMLLRRKLEEQAEVKQAIELQGRRLMNLQLPDLDERMNQHQRGLCVGSPVLLSPQLHANINRSVILPSKNINQEIAEGQPCDGNYLIIDLVYISGRCRSLVVINMCFVGSGHMDNLAAAAENLLQQETNLACIHVNDSANSIESFRAEEFDLHKRYGTF